MDTESSSQVISVREPPHFFVRAWFDAFARRFPFLALFVAILASNAAGSFFNFHYNTLLIVSKLTQEQQDAFWNVAAPLYNVIAYPLGLSVMVYLIWPLIQCLRQMRHGVAIDPAFAQFCRRRLANLPIAQLIINPLGWAPGMIIFPWVIVSCGGAEDAGFIWGQFFVSFLVSTVLTTVQTFFILRSFLTAYLYPEFFQDTRPESVPGIIWIPFAVRMAMMFFAVTVMPLVALLAVALNLIGPTEEHSGLLTFAIRLVLISAVSSGAITWLAGRDLRRWIQLQTRATAQIAEGNFDIRIEHPSPDEWGRLTNRFNDMATALHKAWEAHETLGQFVSPEVRDRILQSMHGFEVHLQEITVLFVDIRGFTPRCAGASPEVIGALLNRFLTLALQSIEEKGGYVNKFLGDGVMALFGATHQNTDHADLAIASSRELLRRLCVLNAELKDQGEAPLIVGIGIHTGPALVGCFGATVQGEHGRPLMRREFTAIGETVNLCQRIEQLTKTCGGPILISEDTRLRLVNVWQVECVGPQELKGSSEPMIVYQVAAG